MTIFRLNGVQLLKEPRLISTRYSLHPTEQVPVYGGGDQAMMAETSLRECVLFTTVQVLHSDSRGHSLTKTEIFQSAALSTTCKV